MHPHGGMNIPPRLFSDCATPVKVVRAAVDGSSASATADAEGRFRISGLPAGTYKL